MLAATAEKQPKICVIIFFIAQTAVEPQDESETLKGRRDPSDPS